MTREEIKLHLPHREPMLLVDESEIVDGKVHSRYTIKEDEFFTRGHFPGYPVVPGVMLCEIMAQASFLLIPQELLVGQTALYAGIDGAKFKRSVVPGDTVCTEATLEAMKGPLVIVNAKATVDGQLCCRGKLTFMLVPNENLKR